MINRLLAILFVTCFPVIAFAHGLAVKASQTSDTVRVVAFFDTEDPAEETEITMIAADGRVIAKGMTDSKGVFTFPTPEAGEYQIVADAGLGHRAKTMLSIATTVVGEPKPELLNSHYLKWFGIAIGFAAIAAGTMAWKRMRSMSSKPS